MNGNDKSPSMAALILSKYRDGKKSGDVEVKPTAQVGEDDNDAGLRSAAEDMLQAMQSKDPHGLVMALKAFIDLYDGDEDDSEEEQEE